MLLDHQLTGNYMISKILVPIDGSKAAQKAASYAVNLAKQLKAKVFILSVIDTHLFIFQKMPVSGTIGHIMDPLNDYLHEVADMYTKEIKQLCGENGIQSEVVITIGHPVEEIIKEAEKLKVDIIVMGSHGHSALAATILGGVTYGVIHKDTKTPVLVVK
ncbi:MAG: hypothetical protein A2X78_03745 [Gammaproteobacteria bacterium GWE2_37_16]|nr:MAG: hypothetical protein A2X78_03745 [Gammaproteobacteria bacterium GWE2_37_16]